LDREVEKNHLRLPEERADQQGLLPTSREIGNISTPVSQINSAQKSGTCFSKYGFL
jgi:hypothetical protein